MTQRIAIAGAGGLGSWVGALLSTVPGVSVTLLARGERYRLLREGGVSVTTGSLAERYAPGESLQCLDTADDQSLAVLADHDWLLFACKSQHTATLAQRLLPFWAAQRAGGGDGAAIGSLQNGVDNELVLGRIFGVPIIGGFGVRFAAHLSAQGGVEVAGHPAFVLGEYPTGSSERIERLVSCFCAAGFDARQSEDIRRELWQKLIINNAANPLSALLGRDTRALCEDPRSREVARNMMREAASVAVADGVAFSERQVDDLYELLAGMAPIRSSMQVDAQRGTELELEGITGAVVERARTLGQVVPVTATVQALLGALYAAKPANSADKAPQAD